MSGILVIEDNETMREGISQILRKMGCKVAEAERGTDGLSLLEQSHFDLVVTDFKMDGMDGMQVLERIKSSNNKDTDVILITAFGSIDMAVEAMRKGASDYIAKPFSPEEFKVRVNKVLKFRKAEEDKKRLADENIFLRNELKDIQHHREMVGESRRMMDIFEKISKVAESNSSVMIYGESGTGKELVAQAVHDQSPRKDKPFIKVNCGALAEGVLESELFGHEKGAFTGSVKRKRGRFELADKGSIFLDEIGDISLSTQIKLLRVLQEKELERVGGEETIKVDVRIISATNKNLLELVEKGRFREDLYYRLHIIPIDIPPLRERKEDISDLVHYFIEKVCAETNRKPFPINDAAMKMLIDYDWPGNVRELENIIERSVVLCEGNEIAINDIPLLDGRSGHRLDISDSNIPLEQMLEKVERQLIERAMERAKGIKTKAARILGIKTSSLYYKLEKYRLI